MLFFGIQLISPSILARDKSDFINEYEKEIVLFMYRFGDKISTRTVAKEVKIHWKTAKKNLETLEKKGIINKVSLGNKIL